MSAQQLKLSFFLVQLSDPQNVSKIKAEYVRSFIAYYSLSQKFRTFK